MKPQQKNYPQQDKSRLEEYHKASFDLKLENDKLKKENQKLREALDDIIHVVNDLSTTTSNDHTIISHAGYDRIMEYEKLLNKQ